MVLPVKAPPPDGISGGIDMGVQRVLAARVWWSVGHGLASAQMRKARLDCATRAVDAWFLAVAGAVGDDRCARVLVYAPQMERRRLHNRARSSGQTTAPQAMPSGALSGEESGAGGVSHVEGFRTWGLATIAVLANPVRAGISHRAERVGLAHPKAAIAKQAVVRARRYES